MFGRRREKTKLAMRNESKGRTMGKLWECTVQYDAWGHPYGTAHDRSVLKLNKDGTTADTAIYGTEWKHSSGPSVIFPVTQDA